MGAFVTFETSEDVERVQLFLTREKKNKINLLNDHIFIPENHDVNDDRIIDFAV